MVLIGAITVFRGILLFITQIVAAIVAAAIVNALFTGGLNVSTTLNATTSVAQGTVIEMLLTAQLVFTIFMLAAEKHTGTFIAPVGIGLSLFIAELTGEYQFPSANGISATNLSQASSGPEDLSTQLAHSDRQLSFVNSKVTTGSTGLDHLQVQGSPSLCTS